MESIKDYIGKQFVGKRLHLKCDCVFPIDITGLCVDYKIHGNEVILVIDVNGKVTQFGENHPNLKIEIL